MKLSEFFNASGGRVTGGSAYGWNCFPNAQLMDVSNISGNDVGSCVYNRTTFDVYEVTVSNNATRSVYKWTSPDFLQAYIDEANMRGVDPNNAYDDVQYTHIAEPEEILGIVYDICHATLQPAEVKATSGWPFPNPDDHDHSSCSHDHVIDEADDGDGNATDDGSGYGGGCCGSCNGGCHSQPEDAPEIVAPVESAFKVKIELCHEFDVDATSMEEAIAKAKYFVKQMKPMPSWPDGLCWMDSYLTKESVARELVTTSYDD